MISFPSSSSWILLWWLAILRLVFISGGLSLSTPTTTYSFLSHQRNYFVGLDYGTSGARISIVQQIPHPSTNHEHQHQPNHQGRQQQQQILGHYHQEVFSCAVAWGVEHGQFDDPHAWLQAMDTLLQSASKATVMATVAPAMAENGAQQHQQAVPLLSLVSGICVSGTSASVLLVDGTNNGRITRSSCMYNYNVLTSHPRQDPIYGIQAISYIDQYAPRKHTCRSPTGSLAKLLAWHQESMILPHERLCHQADYITMHLIHNLNERRCGAGSTVNHIIVRSDWHNCLKLGYDVEKLQWPQWLCNCLESVGIRQPMQTILPTLIVSPGYNLGTIHPTLANQYHISPQTRIIAGTTDSNAAFIAATAVTTTPSGRTTPSSYGLSLGTAVTSLGSTVALKQLSLNYVEDADLGVYSHRFPESLQSIRTDRNVTNTNGHHHGSTDSNMGKQPLGNNGTDDNEGSANNTTTTRSPVWWLVGGASNVGCAILRQENFTNDELDQLSTTIDPNVDSPLSYYPLTRPGERFPIADTNKQPMLQPVPSSRVDYLHGILQGISDVERDGYLALGKLGVTPYPPHTIWTSGGGSRNTMWTTMRQRRLQDAFRTSLPNVNNIQPVGVAKAYSTEASFGAAVLAASVTTSSISSSKSSLMSSNTIIDPIQ